MPIVLNRVLSIVATSICFVCSGAVVQSTSVEVSYSLGADRISLHEPFVVKFQIQNNFNEAIKTDLGVQLRNFQFTVLRPDGTRVTFSPPLKEGFTPLGNVAVGPGQTFAKELLLSDWFDFDAPGQYQIVVTLKAPIQNKAGGVLVHSSSPPLVLAVETRDQEELRKTCTALLDTIVSAGSYSEAEMAAKSLADIKDPVAVPFLRRATAYWHLQPITIRGLGKIGDEAATDVLISLFHGQEPETVALARSALMRVQMKTTNKDLKEKILKELHAEQEEGHM